MNTKNINANTDLDEELSAIIGDMNDEPAISATSEEVIEIDTSEEDLAQIEAELAAADVRAEAYAEQLPEEPSNAPAETEEDAVVAAGKKPKGSKKAPRTSSVTPITGLKPSEALTRVVPEEELLKVALLTSLDNPDRENADAVLSKLDLLAKKVGQKAINVLRFADSPVRVEGYVRKGLDFLLSEADQGRSITCGGLYEVLRRAGYTEGTARSQSSQLNVLFPALKIVNQTGKDLAVNEDSVIVQRYVNASLSIAAAAAA